MLVGISGPSSSGKGTVLYDLESFGVQVIQNRYARTLLKEKNLTVDELYQKSFNEIKQFHIQLVEFKDKHERPFIQTPTQVLVERTFIDFYVYMTTQTGIEDLEFLALYKKKTHEFYRSIVYLNQCPIIEDDGVRIVSEERINNQKNLFETIWSHSEFTNKVLRVPQMKRSERTSEIISYLKGL